MTAFQKIKRFFSPINEHPWDYFWNILEGLILTGYLIVTLQITKDIVTALQYHKTTELHHTLIVFIVVATVFSLGRFVFYRTGWIQIVSNGVSIYLDKYMEKYIQADGNSVEKLGTGRVLTILDKGVYTWFDLLFNLTFKGVANIFFTFFAIYTIFTISPLGGWISIVLFVISGFVATLANIWMAKKRFLRRDAYKEAVHKTTVMIMTKNEILQSRDLYTSLMDSIKYYLQLSKIYQYPVNIGFTIIEEFPRFTLSMLRVVLYLYIADILWSGESSFANLALFITIMAIAEKALNEFLHLMRDVLKDFSSVELLWSTFDALTPIKGYHTGSPFTPTNKPIIIKDITYGYNETKVFQNFSLSIEKGKKTALVGASGGGKTTLMKLIAGYLHPDEGYISVLGNRLDETALKTYYPHIGYLTQDPSVFDGTIRENLVSAVSIVSDLSSGGTKDLLQKRRADSSQARNDKEQDFSLRSAPLEMTEAQEIEQKLTEALSLAHCDFVFELEHGLDTEIGERGVRLSGGQKQRLAIAKIFLKNPEIILLDEPTSALDSFSEEQITKALDTLFKDRTVLIIAHRLQTVKKADDIIVIEGGNIEERGSHEQLIAKGGIYHKMLELQSGF